MTSQCLAALSLCADWLILCFSFSLVGCTVFNNGVLFPVGLEQSGYRQQDMTSFDVKCCHGNVLPLLILGDYILNLHIEGPLESNEPMIICIIFFY